MTGDHNKRNKHDNHKMHNRARLSQWAIVGGIFAAISASVALAQVPLQGTIKPTATAPTGTVGVGGAGTAAATKPADASAVKIVVPGVAQAFIERAAGIVNRTKGGVQLDLLQNGTHGGAVTGIVGGRDFVITTGQIVEADFANVKAKWTELKPTEDVLGARSLAIIVHPDNPLESLTLEQLQSLYIGKVADWKLLGGQPKPVRCMGLAQNDPLCKLFQDKGMGPARTPLYMRKNNADELIAAVASDPGAIGFVDAVAAATAAKRVRMVPFNIGKSMVWPNAQTIRDKTYPLCEPLVLYVSAKAKPQAKALASFLTSGRADYLLRETGYLPAVQPVTEQAAALFDRLYAEDFKRVHASSEPDDDIALAEQILEAARTTRLDEVMISVMCDAAFKLATTSGTGTATAFEAAETLAQRLPAKKFEAAVLRNQLYERGYEIDKSRVSGEHLIRVLMVSADWGVEVRRFADADKIWRRALEVADQVKAPQLSALQKRAPAFASRVKAAEDLEYLFGRADADPDNAQHRQNIVTHLVSEMDDPAAAAKFLDADSDEAYKGNLPLALMKVEELAEDSAFRLGEWYGALGAKASPGGQELLYDRAIKYYLRCMELHKNRDDMGWVRIELALKKIGGEVPSAYLKTAKPPANRPNPNPNPNPNAAQIAAAERKVHTILRASLKDEPPITDTRLAEHIVANPDITNISRAGLGTLEYITDIRPLARLKKLKGLDLEGAVKLQYINGVAQLEGLETLNLKGLAIESVATAATLSQLTTLDLSGMEKLTDIAPICQLPRLKTLNLSGSKNVTGLSALTGLTSLTRLDLAGCVGLVDVAFVEKMPQLTSINISNCSKVKDIYLLGKMAKLKEIDLRGCPNISEGDLAWLATELPKCNIRKDKAK